MEIKDELKLILFTCSPLLHVEVVLGQTKDGVVLYELGRRHCAWPVEVDEWTEDISTNFGNTEFKWYRFIVFEKLLDNLHLIGVYAVSLFVAAVH